MWAQARGACPGWTGRGRPDKLVSGRSFVFSDRLVGERTVRHPDPRVEAAPTSKTTDDRTREGFFFINVDGTVRQTEHEKAKVRDAALERRRDLTETQRRVAAADVRDRLQEWDVTREPRPTAGYVAFDNEVDIGEFLDHKLSQGSTVALPRVEDGASMVFSPVDSLEALEPGAFGIPEPTGAPLDIAELEVFLVPGAAFDGHGHRIGMGRGYYDRALDRRLDADGTEPIFVGVCYDCQFFDDELPVEPHDISVDAVVTPSQILESSE